MLNKNKKYNLGYILIYLFLLVSPPFVFQLFPGIPGWQTLYIITFPVLVLYAIRHRLSLFRNEVRTMTIIWTLGWLFFLVYHQDTIYLSRIAMAIISAVVLSVILSLGVKRFCKIYIYLITVMAIAGTIAFFVVFLLGLSPIFSYENVDGKIGYCFGLSCTNTYLDYVNIFRYSGFFDEPGAMGLWGLYAILLNKLLFDNRKIEIILISCLIFTFSIGFYVSIVVYLFLFYFNLKNKKMVLSLVLLFISVSSFILSNESFYNMTIGRFAYDESTGTIAGNNRETQQKNATKYFFENPLLGVGADNAVKMVERGVDINDNIMTPFAKDGLIGMLVIYYPFFFVLLKKHKNKVARNCLWVFTLTFFHRAVIFTVYNLVMYIILLIIVNSNSKYKIKNNELYGKSNIHIYSNSCV